MADPTFTPREPDAPTFTPREKPKAVETPTFTPRNGDPYDPLAASAGVAPAGTPTIDKLFTGPSWLDKALDQSKKDLEAFAKGGVKEMLKDTEGTQELAGGFSDAGIAGVTKKVGGAAGKAAAEQLRTEVLTPAAIKAVPESEAIRQSIPAQGDLSPGFIRAQENALHQITQSSEADKIEFLKYVDKLPPELKTPHMAEKFYHAVEGGELTPEERVLFDKHFMPLQRFRANLYKDITGSGVPIEDLSKGVHRIAKGTAPHFDEIGGQPIDPIVGARTLPRTTSSLKERTYYALEGKDGSRLVVQKLKNGGAQIWQDGRIIGEVPGDIEVGEQARVLDTPFTVKQATTKEIEQHTPTEYRKNAFENTIDDIIRLRKVKRSIEYTDTLKASPEWQKHAAMGNQRYPRGWVTTDHPQFRGWVMEPKIAHVLDDFAGMRSPLEDTLGKVNAFLTRTLFWGPIPHVENVLGHWIVGRGFDWLRPAGYKSVAIDGAKALKEVYGQGPVFRDLLRHGSGLQSPRTTNRLFYEQLVQKMGGEIERNPDRWGPIFQTLGMNKIADGVAWWYNQSSKIMWQLNDVMMVQRVLELERKGSTRMHAIEEAEKHIPNYRIPSEVMGRRDIAEYMKNPNYLVFAPYHYGVFKSYANVVRDVRSGTPRERWEGLGNIMALAMLSGVVYPMLLSWLAKEVTGDKHAKKLSRGPAAIPQALVDLYGGDKGLPEIISNVMTPAPVMKFFGEIAADVFNKNRIYEPADLRHHRYGRVAAQLLDYAAQNAISPYQLLNQYIKDEKEKGFVRTIIEQQLGVKEPTSRQRTGKAKAFIHQEREARKRQARPHGLIESGEKKAEKFMGPMQ